MTRAALALLLAVTLAACGHFTMSGSGLVYEVPLRDAPARTSDGGAEP